MKNRFTGTQAYSTVQLR